MGRADDAHRGRAAILLVLRVEDEQKVEGLHEHRIGVVLADPPHHVEEVGGEAQRVVGVDEREARAEPMAARRERRHLRDEAEDLLVAGLRVEDVLRVVVEGRQRSDGRDEHPHRVRVVVEPVHEPLAHVLVDERVVRDVRGPQVELVGGRQLAVQQQVRHFEVRRLLGELLDRIPAVAQDAGVAIEVRDGARTGRGGEERRVVHPQVWVELSKLRRREHPVGDVDSDLFAGAVVDDGDGVSHPRSPLDCRQPQRT